MSRDLNVGIFYINFLYDFSANLNSDDQWDAIFKTNKQRKKQMLVKTNT